MKAIAGIYVQQLKTTIAMMFQYRVSLLIWMIGQVLEPLVYLIVWSAVSKSSGGNVGGYSTSDFAAYFIILMLINQLTYTWIMYTFEYRIRQGNLSISLLKPVHPIHSDIADNVSAKLITLPIMILVGVGLALVFHASINFTLWAIAVSVPVLILSFLIRFLLEWTVALTAFWTMRVSAVNQTYYMMVLFLSGQIAPLTLLPHPVQMAAYILPFRWMIGFPVELLLGRLTPTQALTGLGIQVAWLIVVLAFLRIVWRKGVRIYSAVGA